MINLKTQAQTDKAAVEQLVNQFAKAGDQRGQGGLFEANGGRQTGWR
jgi:hypothetical protein